MNIENNNLKDIPGFVEWRDRINNLQEIEGREKPDFNRIWTRLEMRLTEPPRKKSRLVYWLAAACLLLAVSVTGIMYFRQTPQGLALKPVPKTTPVMEKIIVPGTTKEVAPLATTKDFIQKQQPKILPVIINKKSGEIAQQPKQQQDSNNVEPIVPQEVLSSIKTAPVNPDDRKLIYLDEVKAGAAVAPVAGNNKRKTVTIQLNDRQAAVSSDAPGNDQSLHEN